jgi:hypothetical protein
MALTVPDHFSFIITTQLSQEFRMASHRSYQDVIWGDSTQIAHDLITELITRHDKRAVSTVQYREKEKTKKNHQGQFAEVFKFVAEQKQSE